jgi:hypothetical protein
MRRPELVKGVIMLWRIVSVMSVGTPRNRVSMMILVVLRVGLLLLQLLIVPIKGVAVRIRGADLTVRAYSDQLV